MTTPPPIGNEVPAIVRPGQFRHSIDVENFYRFIHDNNLRREAKFLLEAIHEKVVGKRRSASKKRKSSK